MNMQVNPNAAVSADGTVSSAKAAPEVQAEQAAGVSETGKAAAAPARRPSCDQYVPQKPEEPYGHYKPVSDGQGNTRIQFDAPSRESEAGREDRASAPKQKGVSGGRQNTQVLETRKKRLEQQVRSAGDSEERKTLKQKLEQVKRALKAAGKK